MKIAVQFDFDGTVTEEDISFLLLDTYAGSEWRDALKEYTEGRITVGVFNRRVFGMVKAGKQTMLNFVLNSDRVRVRPGFRELVDYCLRQDFKIITVSNGLFFYIEAILDNLGVRGIEVYAAENDFNSDGMKVRYIGPDGNELESGFKEAYTEMLQKQGFEVIYIGDGASDIFSARRAFRVFATGDLLRKCREEKIECTPFNDFYDVLEGMKLLPNG